MGVTSAVVRTSVNAVHGCERPPLALFWRVVVLLRVIQRLATSMLVLPSCCLDRRSSAGERQRKAPKSGACRGGGLCRPV